MIDITDWMNRFLKEANKAFEDRIWFVGLQGSYGRKEATEESDIDVVVILDTLSASDIQAYGRMLGHLPCRQQVCGFLSGKREILNWEPSDLFQFYYDTTPIKGSLDDLLALIDDVAVEKAIKSGVCNIYHGCVHNMLHDRNDEILRGLYKSASFVVQAIVFQQTGRYIRHQAELRSVASPDEQHVIDTFMRLKQGGAVEFDKMSEALFVWSQKRIAEGNTPSADRSEAIAR